MLDQIQQAFDQQRAALTPRSGARHQLRQFVADASHELRTPLTTLRGYADLYRAGALAEQDELNRAMRRIGTESARMGASSRTCSCSLGSTRASRSAANRST